MIVFERSTSSDCKICLCGMEMERVQETFKHLVSSMSKDGKLESEVGGKNKVPACSCTSSC